MTRLDRKTSIAWIAGTYGTPVSVATYRFHNLGRATEQAVAIPNASFVGAFSPDPSRPGGRFGVPTFSREIRGSSSSNVPPADGSLLRALGFEETVSGAALHYDLGDLHLYGTGPSDAGILDAVNINVYQDGLFRVFNNCVGTGTFNFIAGEIPTIDYAFRGQIDDSKKGGIEGTPPGLATEPNPKPAFNESLNVSITRTGTVTGTTTGTTSTTVCIDSAATFITSGVLFGDAMEMDSGGETATIVSVDSETQVTTSTLSGAGTYDNGEDYTITKETSYNVANLVVPRIIYNVNNTIDPRPGLNGESGFEPPILTMRQPQIAMTVEIPEFERFNFEREFVEATTLDVGWTHEVDNGIGYELAVKFSGRIVAMPEPAEVNGKLVYNLALEQGIETGDDAFQLHWKGS